MASKKGDGFSFKPIDGEWSRAVFQPYDTELLLSFTHQADEVDYHMAYASLLDELATRAIEDRSILGDVISALGRHMRVFPRISMGMPLSILGLERLLGEGSEVINQEFVNHANDWDVERQINFFDKIAPLSHQDEDRVLYRQLQLQELIEKYGFAPKFEVKDSDFMPGYPQYYPI